MDLSGRVVAVTGGASGLGRAIVDRVVSLGAAVAVLDLDQAATLTAVDDLSGRGADVIGISVDVSDELSVHAAFDQIMDRHGSLQGLVTSAGVRQSSAPSTDLSLAEWDRVMRIDLTGTFLSARKAATVMESGSIVTIGSTSASLARLGQAAYCSAKAAVVALTKVMALELAERGIRVNCISPASAATGLSQQWASPQESGIEDRIWGNLNRFRAGIPLRRLVEPVEVAEAAAFLLSDASSFVTGHELAVDGGETLI